MKYKLLIGSKITVIGFKNSEYSTVIGSKITKYSSVSGSEKTK